MRRAFLGFLIAVLFTVQAAAQELRFRSILEIPYDRTKAQTSIVNGTKPADPADWTSTFFYVRPQSTTICSSTLVGSKALLTAAHCIANGATIRIGVAGVAYDAVCTHAPEFSSNTTVDLAACLLSSEVRDARVQYETVGLDQSQLKTGVTLLMTGFGCTSLAGGGQREFRTGDAPVVRLPSDDKFDMELQGQVALCFGDSGGGTFLKLDSEGKRRVQLSVNSHSNIRDTSTFASLGTAPAANFLRSWSAQNGLRVCGVHPDANGCRR
ncbi:MAG: trypsin-like serine protease [Vicinamibacterales bacterium]